MFFAIRLGFTMFKAARSLYTASQRMQAVAARYRTIAVRAHNQIVKIDRDARGLHKSVNDTAKSLHDTMRASAQVGASMSRLGSRGLVQLEISTNAHQVAGELGAMVDKIDAEIRRTLTAAGAIVAGEAGRNAFEFRYLGQLHRSYAVNVRSFGSEHVAHIGSNLVHAAVQEFGRKPGKMPPHAPIAAWAERKGIDSNLVYPIRRKIAKKGTPARRNLGRALESKEKEIRDLFERRINAVLSSL